MASPHESRMLDISQAPLPPTTRILRRSGGIEMSQEIVRVRGRKDEVMRYFVGIPSVSVKSFDRAHEAWDHFRALTRTANTPPDILASLPPAGPSPNSAVTSRKMRRAPRAK